MLHRSPRRERSSFFLFFPSGTSRARLNSSGNRGKPRPENRNERTPEHAGGWRRSRAQGNNTSPPPRPQPEPDTRGTRLCARDGRRLRNNRTGGKGGGEIAGAIDVASPPRRTRSARRSTTPAARIMAWRAPTPERQCVESRNDSRYRPTRQCASHGRARPRAAARAG